MTRRRSKPEWEFQEFPGPVDFASPGDYVDSVVGSSV